VAAVVTINGVVIDRIATGLNLHRLSPYPKDGCPSLLMSVEGFALADREPDPWLNRTILLTIDSVDVFSGYVEKFLTHMTEGGCWVREYTCLGLRSRADTVPVTDSITNTDTASFNLHGEDADFVASRAGRTIGQVVAEVLVIPAIAGPLFDMGVKYTRSGAGPYTYALPSATTADLATLTWISMYPLQVGGERVLSAIDGVIRSAHPNHCIHFEPDGTLRIRDVRTFTARTLTLGTDPILPPAWQTDIGECYTRTLARGWTRVEPVLVGIAPLPGSTAADGGLQELFAYDAYSNSGAKAVWNFSDFTQPGLAPGTATGVATVASGAVTAIAPAYQGHDYPSAPSVTLLGGGGSGATATSTLTSGKVTGFTVTAGGSGYTGAPTVIVGPPGTSPALSGTCTVTTTTATVTPPDAAYFWASNFWDETSTGKHGVITLYSDTTTNIDQWVTRRVVSNTALTAGAGHTSVLTFDSAVPVTTYTAYTLVGQAGGASFVGRRYRVTNAAVAAAMVNYFPYPVPQRNSDGSAVSMVTAPTATLFHSSTGLPPYTQIPWGFESDPVAGTILMYRPTQLAFSPDGTTPVWCDDVQVFLAVQNGALNATWPADVSGVPQYSGTAYSDYGLARTKTITVPDWRDDSNSANMLIYAQEYDDCFKDVVQEGSVTYLGLPTNYLLFGSKLSIAGNGYTTGLESLAAPVTNMDLEFNEDPGSPTSYAAVISFSTRRAPFSASNYTRPAIQGQSFGQSIDGGFSMGQSVSAPTNQGIREGPPGDGSGMGGFGQGQGIREGPIGRPRTAREEDANRDRLVSKARRDAGPEAVQAKRDDRDEAIKANQRATDAGPRRAQARHDARDRKVVANQRANDDGTVGAKAEGVAKGGTITAETPGEAQDRVARQAKPGPDDTQEAGG
jgi:hypothetical protein